MNIRVTLALVWTLTLATALLASRPQEKRPLRETEMNAVIEAIQDEIYDLNLEKYVNDIGTRSPNNRNQYSVNVYFQPEVIENSRSWVIYKLMPDGEILRMYELGRSGRIYLHGKPGEFRMTQPDYPTVFMDDDELCKLKHDWKKRYYTVNTDPSAELVAAARARQRARKQAY
jgi:hypothetical protein